MDVPTVWVAFLAGVISFISPCVLPLFPVYLAIAGVGPGSSRLRARLRALRAGFLIMLGFTIMFMLMMGPLVAFFGIRLVPDFPWLETAAGVLFVVFSIWLLPLENIPVLKYLKMPFSLIPAFNVRFEESPLFKRKYAHAFMPLALGASLAIVWIPCIGPYLGVIILLAGSEETMLSGTYLLFIYCVGLSTPFLLSAFLLDKATAIRKRLVYAGIALKILAGIAVLGFGIIILAGNMAWLESRFAF